MVKNPGVFTMTRNSYLIPALMGIFTGLVFFGVQVSLDAVNHMVRPHNPYTLYSICRVEPDKWHFVILEKSFYVTLPPAKLPTAAGEILLEAERFAVAKYSSVQGEGSKFVNAAMESLNNAWKEFLRIAGEARGRFSCFPSQQTFDPVKEQDYFYAFAIC